jgi:hypothetical protein
VGAGKCVLRWLSKVRQMSYYNAIFHQKSQGMGCREQIPQGRVYSVEFLRTICNALTASWVHDRGAIVRSAESAKLPNISLYAGIR